MKIEEALIRLRDDLKEWVMNNLNAIGGGGGSSSNITYVTQEEYDALPDSKLSNDVEYRITDAYTSSTVARNISYDNSESGIEAVSVQSAIDKVSESLEKFKSRAVLYQGVCGTASEVPLYDDISKYNFIRLELILNNIILNETTVNMSEFVTEKYGLRSVWADGTDLFTQDIAYVSNTSISANFYQSKTFEGFYFRIIGFN